MDPVYMNLRPHPFQKDRTHHGPRYYPGFEATPDQMYVNQARPPMAYGFWPWGSNYGYPSPIGCHNCCNHSYTPAHYGWGSPYSHVPPAHCYGGYAPFPVQYMPPPCYGMEQPQYEHEKSMPRYHHCCGSPNHLLNQKEQKGVRIEEEEPDRERRRGDSVIPFKFKNSPYPIVWLPPDYISNQAQPKDGNSGDRKDGSAGVRAPENEKVVEQQKPTLWDGWYPLDLSNLVPSKQRVDGERHHQEDDGKGRVTFPLFWMPYKHEEREGEDLKAGNANTKPSLESQRVSGGEHKFHSDEENAEGEAASRVKVMPLMETKQHEEKLSQKNQEKGRVISVKDGNDNGEKKIDNVEKKSPKEVAKRKSPLPPKSSKLPPVCLRVDPLPRRKTGNGSSRSPSPPGDKDKLDGRSDEASKGLNSSDDKKADKEFKESKGTKTIQVVYGNTHQQNTKELNVGTLVDDPVKSQENVPTSQREEKAKEESISNECTESDAVTKGQSEGAEGDNEELLRAEGKADEAKESRKKKLTEEEAAVIIQSTYRGFDTRRWEPMIKLKQIAKVKEQIADVKRHIQAMELSTDLEGSGKQRNFIAETIMSLLLKLDTVQGLHPSIRDVRKSVVKELVSLQERLDSLMNERTENSSGSESVIRQSEEAILSQSGDETSSDLPEVHQKQLDGGSESDHKKLDISEANPTGEEAGEKLELEAAVRCTSEGPGSASEPTIQNEDEMSNQVLEKVETSIAKEDSVDHVLEQRSEHPALQGSSSVKAEDLAPIFEELPNYITDKENDENVEIQETSNLQRSRVNVESKAEETSPLDDGSCDNCKMIGEFGREEDLDNKTGDGSIIEPEEERTIQQLENIVADMSEPFEASDETGLPIAEACNTKDAFCETHKELGENDSNNSIMLEKTINRCLDKEMHSQECKLEQEIGINESAYADEEGDVIGGKEMGDAKSEDEIPQEHMAAGAISDDRESQVEACQVKSEEPIDETIEVEVISQGGKLKENIEMRGCEDARKEEENASQNVVGAVFQEGELQENIEMQGSEDARGDGENGSQNAVDIMSSDEARDSSVSPINPRDERDEGNRRLIEENEGLREIMAKLIKSGEEQLTAISSLSGRVKDLERRLSRRKKKLRVKQYRAPRSGSLSAE